MLGYVLELGRHKVGLPAQPVRMKIAPRMGVVGEALAIRVDGAGVFGGGEAVSPIQIDARWLKCVLSGQTKHDFPVSSLPHPVDPQRVNEAEPLVGAELGAPEQGLPMPAVGQKV